MMKPKIHINKLKITIFSAIALLAILIIGVAVIRINDWFENNKFEFSPLVNIVFNQPVRIVKREVPTQEIIRIIETIPAPEDLETDIEHYIYEKFGIENYRLALAIAMAESHMNCNAIGLNETSVDLGLFQVNSLWLKDYSLLQLADCKGNVDAAYRIWDRGDGEEGNGKGSFNPWTVAKNGAYLKYLE